MDNIHTHKPFIELVELSKRFDLEFELESSVGDSLKLTNHFHPWSLRESEAKIVYDLILKNDIKRGFEIATAFGISSTVIGQALNKTNGKLVTMDAYVEEHFNQSSQYDINTKLVKTQETADGYRMASNLVKALDLSENVFLEIGWSPTDVPSAITKHFGNSKLDFAFIDGGHSEEQIHADVNVILQFMDDNCIMFFHDHQCVSGKTIDFIKSVGFNNFVNYNTPFNLWAYSRGNKLII
jgi:predicted O-methyltransferase YrrM